MSEELLRELQRLSQKAEEEVLTSEEVIKILSGVGALRKKIVPSTGIPELREIEKNIRSHFSFYLKGFGKYMDNQPWDSMVSYLQTKKPDREKLKDFSECRQRAELALWVMEEYCEEVAPQEGEALGKIRRILDRADEGIFFNTPLVKALHRENGDLTALHTDRDFFWWIPGKEECAVPLHKKLLHLTGYQEGRLERPLREALQIHLLSCPPCREELQNIEEVRIEELLEFFEAPEFAAAQGQDLPHLTSLIWQDDEGKWEAVLYMASSSVDEEVSFSLKVPPGQKGEFLLMVGEKGLAVSEGHTEKISRERIRRALKKNRGQLKIRFESEREEVILYYRGER